MQLGPQCAIALFGPDAGFPTAFLLLDGAAYIEGSTCWNTGQYGWALDTGDVDAFVACFAPDGVMIEQVFEDPDVWAGHDGLRRLAEQYCSIPNFPGRQHYCSNTLVTAQPGGRAHARSFALVTECQGEPPYLLRFCGYFDDELVCPQGQWLFERRTLRLWRSSGALSRSG